MSFYHITYGLHNGVVFGQTITERKFHCCLNDVKGFYATTKNHTGIIIVDIHIDVDVVNIDDVILDSYNTDLVENIIKQHKRTKVIDKIINNV